MGEEIGKEMSEEGTREIDYWKDKDERVWMMRDILDWAHGVTGHFGEKATVWKIQERFGPVRGIWPLVREKIRKCAICQKEGDGKKELVGSSRNIATWQPFEEVCIDFLAIEGSHKKVFVLVESFSRFVILIALHKTDAENALRALRSALARIPRPKRVRADADSVFKGKLRDWVEENGMEYREVLAGHHQANGRVEKYMRVIAKQLRARLTMAGDRDNWDVILDEVAFTINSKPCSVTLFSPMEIICPDTRLDLEGAAVRFKAALMVLQGKRDDVVDDEDCERDREESLFTAFHVGFSRGIQSERVRQAQANQFGELDGRKRREPENPDVLRLGEYVLVRPEKATGKLEGNLLGPHKVVGREHENIYLLRSSRDESRIVRKHISSLVRAVFTDEDASMHASNDFPHIFLVEKILEHRPEEFLLSEFERKKDSVHKTQFLIKWRFYSDVFTTWETTDTLPSKNFVLQDYLQKNSLTLKGGSVWRTQ